MRLIAVAFVITTLMPHPGWSLEEDWQPGVLTLKNDQVLQGELWVRMDCDVAILRNGEAMMVYPAHRIAGISIFDRNANQKRTFVSMTKTHGAAVFHELYEVVLYGAITVLRKEKSAWQSRAIPDPEFDYFVYYGDQLLPVSKFRKKVFRKLATPEVKKYARKNGLNLFRIPDTVRIIEFINRSVSPIELAQQ